MPATRSLAVLVLFLALALASGCSDDNTMTPPPDNRITRQIDDMNYVRGKYFFLQFPAEQLASGARIDFATLRVFVDDMNGSNNFGARVGSGEIDPTLAPGASPRIIPEYFDQLQELADYEVTTAPYGDRFPVLILQLALAQSQVLAVTYEEVLPGGARRAVGSVPDCFGGTCPPVRLRLIQAPKDVYLAKVGATDDYETDYGIAPFNQVRELELKSVYDLQFTGFDPSDLEIEVRSYVTGNDYGGFDDDGDIFGYLRVLGVDLYRDDGTGVPTVGSDQVVDVFTPLAFLDPARGTLMFPDLRPFDPRLPGRPDARPEELEFFRSRLDATPGPIAVPGLRARVFWPQGAASPPGSSAAVTPMALVTNPHVYDRRNVQLVADRRYYLLVRGPGL